MTHFRIDPAALAVARTEQAKTNALLDTIFADESDTDESELDAIDGESWAFNDEYCEGVCSECGYNITIENALHHPECPIDGESRVSVTDAFADKLNQAIDRFNSSNREVDPECREQSFNDMWRTTGNSIR